MSDARNRVTDTSIRADARRQIDRQTARRRERSKNAVISSRNVPLKTRSRARSRRSKTARNYRAGRPDHARRSRGGNQSCRRRLNARPRCRHRRYAIAARRTACHSWPRRRTELILRRTPHNVEFRAADVPIDLQLRVRAKCNCGAVRKLHHCGSRTRTHLCSNFKRNIGSCRCRDAVDGDRVLADYVAHRCTGNTGTHNR